MTVIVWDGKTLAADKQMGGDYPRTVTEDAHHAIGSGRDFAAAAMYLGKTAREAVEVAMALTGFCGHGVDTLEFE
jgi:hypothetical protein